MELTISNFKYFKEWDNSDNECCWQIELIGEDLERILKTKGIPYDDMYEDWGLGLSWGQDGIKYSIMVTCVDVGTAKYKVLFEAFKRRFLVMNRLVQIEKTPYAYLVKDIRGLDQCS